MLAYDASTRRKQQSEKRYWLHTTLTQSRKHIHRTRANLDAWFFGHLIQYLKAVAKIAINTVHVGKVRALPHLQSFHGRLGQGGVYEVVACLGGKSLYLWVLGHGASAIAAETGDKALNVPSINASTTRQAGFWLCKKAFDIFAAGGVPVFFKDSRALPAIDLLPLELTRSSEIPVNLIVRAFP